ncbi:hypothetical protein K437DRAFT_254703 [Tilletiaria anomala UBC 951]|uniref:Uncharacterized protein n=1 Tax=Tilletiaria anomala (strain ATCC 24038 / CBS 436.72 / UBC 951) TaxID=1037660 RepID=A0A066WHH7_TILAU|nr:uncharacterized protein K437DRAFT_254703 [Tilletiaria anomala UBC 951]KDN51968.1 hypothetical protein K437DRAFT_254703 [Tilletiaria anomala UBC 951]
MPALCTSFISQDNRRLTILKALIAHLTLPLSPTFIALVCLVSCPYPVAAQQTRIAASRCRDDESFHVCNLDTRIVIPLLWTAAVIIQSVREDALRISCGACLFVKGAT